MITIQKLDGFELVNLNKKRVVAWKKTIYDKGQKVATMRLKSGTLPFSGFKLRKERSQLYNEEGGPA